jgi:DNA polymerase III alpha subunit
MALTLRRRPNDQMRIHELNNLAQRYRVATVVTNDVLFHEPARRILQDVVTCIRHNITIDEAGFRRERHADRYLKQPCATTSGQPDLERTLSDHTCMSEKCHFRTHALWQSTHRDLVEHASCRAPQRESLHGDKVRESNPALAWKRLRRF